MNRPKIVCLCGSTKYIHSFDHYNNHETLAGNIVLSVGCHTKSDDEQFKLLSIDETLRIKAKLDVLHYHKIDLCDEILVLDVNGYIGGSTQREIYYAMSRNKKIRYASEEEGY